MWEVVKRIVGWVLRTDRSTLRREVLLEMKVDRVRANHSLRLTASQVTPNIPFQILTWRTSSPYGHTFRLTVPFQMKRSWTWPSTVERSYHGHVFSSFWKAGDKEWKIICKRLLARQWCLHLLDFSFSFLFFNRMTIKKGNGRWAQPLFSFQTTFPTIIILQSKRSSIE